MFKIKVKIEVFSYYNFNPLVLKTQIEVISLLAICFISFFR